MADEQPEVSASLVVEEPAASPAVEPAPVVDSLAEATTTDAKIDAGDAKAAESDEKGDEKKKHELKEGEIASTCVWVGNVSPEVSQEEFRTAFEQYGKVILIRMFPRSKCAFVTFDKAANAMAALALEGTQMGSMNLTLNIGKASRHLWVGNIGAQLQEKELRAAFEKFGEVESVRVLRANKCAFVNFVSEENALHAAEEMNGSELGKQKIVINFQWASSYRKPRRDGANKKNNKKNKNDNFNDRGFATPSRQLFVGNIVPSVTDETLWQLFSRFGEIEQIKGFTSRGYAFVIFTNIRIAVWVKEQMNHYPPVLGGRSLVVNFGRQPPERPGTNGPIDAMGQGGQGGLGGMPPGMNPFGIGGMGQMGGMGGMGGMNGLNGIGAGAGGMPAGAGVLPNMNGLGGLGGVPNMNMGGVNVNGLGGMGAMNPDLLNAGAQQPNSLIDLSDALNPQFANLNLNANANQTGTGNTANLNQLAALQQQQQQLAAGATANQMAAAAGLDSSQQYLIPQHLQQQFQQQQQQQHFQMAQLLQLQQLQHHQLQQQAAQGINVGDTSGVGGLGGAGTGAAGDMSGIDLTGLNAMNLNMNMNMNMLPNDLNLMMQQQQAQQPQQQQPPQLQGQPQQP